MNASLPAFPDYEPFRAFRTDPAQWLPIAIDIAQSHGLACTAPHVFATGTNLVVALDEKLILKIFPPLLRPQFVSERGSLAQLRGQLRIAIPETVVEGERDGWPYLVITRLPGVLGADAWPSLAEADKERLLAEIGETIADVQRVPAGPLGNRPVTHRGAWDGTSRKSRATVPVGRRAHNWTATPRQSRAKAAPKLRSKSNLCSGLTSRPCRTSDRPGP